MMPDAGYWMLVKASCLNQPSSIQPSGIQLQEV
jgi:hypothetical protein